MGIDKLELVVAEAFVSYNFVRPNYSKGLQSLRDCYVAMKGSYGLQVINYLDRDTCSTLISCITRLHYTIY